MASTGSTRSPLVLIFKVQLEDRQIMYRSLDRNFSLGRRLFLLALSRTTRVSKNRSDGPEIQSATAPVNECLKQLLPIG